MARVRACVRACVRVCGGPPHRLQAQLTVSSGTRMRAVMSAQGRTSSRNWEQRNIVFEV
jgi:hypothetical protein